eukprot:gene12689-15921_t
MLSVAYLMIASIRLPGAPYPLHLLLQALGDLFFKPLGPLQAPCKPPVGPLQAPCRPPASHLQAPCPLQAPCKPPVGPLRAPCRPPASPLELSAQKGTPVPERYIPSALPKAPSSDHPDLSASYTASAEGGGDKEERTRAPRMVDAYKKRQCAIPGGRTFDFGASHVPGWLVQHVDGDESISQLPAKSGTGLKLRPAKLGPSAAVPPPHPEPTIMPDPAGREAAQQHDSLRVTHADRVMNRVVYDSLEPPHMHAESQEADASCPPLTLPKDENGRPTKSTKSYNYFKALPGQFSPKLSDADASYPPLEDENAGPTKSYNYFDTMPGWYSPKSVNDTTLVFESRFESGNLRRALQVYPDEFDLVLRPDINTRGHTQWFYFAVSNTRRGKKAKFNIINLAKDDSLYREGMLPLVHSAKEAATSGVGWHRSGKEIAYYPNTIKRGKNRTYSTFTFTLEFQHSDDTIHVAHCYPYTYTDLQHYIADLEADPERRHRVSRSVLCSTLAGNTCDLLTITTPTEKPEVLARRRGIVISGRVHPGESNASWMMKGVLDFLTGPSLDAKLLRDNFIFKIMPMLNPDGVINGNYRCSLAGVDLNRVWAEPSGKLHPTVYSCRKMVKAFTEEREVAMFCDLHGHSRKKDIFVYGCQKKGRDLQAMYLGYPIPGSMGGRPSVATRFQEKLLPLLIHHNSPDLFNFRYCNFKVQKSKSGTSRVVNFREMGLASFCGPTGGQWAGQHFSTWHLEQMGAALCTTLLDYWDPEDYGISDVIKNLDFMCPTNGDSAPKYVMTPDGQMVEVEEDEPPTDSDDESSDDEEKRAARLARRQAQIAAAAAGGGQDGGSGIGRFLAGFRRQGTDGGDEGVDQRTHSLGLLGTACLAAVRIDDVPVPVVPSHSAPAQPPGVSALATDQDGILPRKSLTPSSSQNDMGSARSSKGRSPAPANIANPKLTPAGLEYARQKGIYRGESLSWANAGTSALQPHSPTGSNHANSLASPKSPSSKPQQSPEALFFGQLIGAGPPSPPSSQIRLPHSPYSSPALTQLPAELEGPASTQPRYSLRTSPNQQHSSPSPPQQQQQQQQQLSQQYTIQQQHQHFNQQLFQEQQQLQQQQQHQQSVQQQPPSASVGKAHRPHPPPQRTTASHHQQQQGSPGLEHDDPHSLGRQQQQQQQTASISYHQQMYPSPQKRQPRMAEGSGGAPMGALGTGIGSTSTGRGTPKLCVFPLDAAGVANYASLASAADSLAAGYSNPGEDDEYELNSAYPGVRPEEHFESLINNDPLFHR